MPGSLAHRFSGILLPLTPISPQEHLRTPLTSVCIVDRIMGLTVCNMHLDIVIQKSVLGRGDASVAKVLAMERDL